MQRYGYEIEYLEFYDGLEMSGFYEVRRYGKMVMQTIIADAALDYVTDAVRMLDSMAVTNPVAA